MRQVTDRMSGCSFDMITLIGGAERRTETIGKVRVFRVGFRVDRTTRWGRFTFRVQKYLFPCIAFAKAIALMKEKKYEVIWSLMANYAGFAALFTKLRFPKLKFLLTLQEGDPLPSIRRKVFFVYPLFRLIFKKADHVHAISNFLADFARRMGSKNVTVIPNGVDVKKFSVVLSERQRREMRETLNVKPVQKVLITTSRLVKKNGIADVLNAFAYLPSHYVFLIIGEGELKPDLLHLVEHLNLSNRVTFLGFVDQADIPWYLALSDIFIRPSLSEGFGNSFIEAMAAGVPVIATRVGGIPDFIIDGSTGIFAMPNNPISIQHAVIRLQDDTLRNSIIAQAKDLSVKYDWDGIASRYQSVLHSL